MSGRLFDFTDPSALQAWTATDDRDMGGVSRSSLECEAAGHGVFVGTVSPERRAGFASVRSSSSIRGKAVRQARCRLLHLRPVSRHS